MQQKCRIFSKFKDFYNFDHFYFLYTTWDRKKRFLLHEDWDILVLIRLQFLLKIDMMLSSLIIYQILMNLH